MRPCPTCILVLLYLYLVFVRAPIRFHRYAATLQLHFTMRNFVQTRLRLQARARARRRIFFEARRARTRAAFTCGAAILITRLSSGGKHKFRPSALFLRIDIDPCRYEPNLLFSSILFFYVIASRNFFNREGIFHSRGFLSRGGLLERERNVEWLYK